MTNLATRVKAALKSFVQGNWVDSSLPGNRYSNNTGSFHYLPNTRINWDKLTGDMWRCPAVQACLNFLFRNFTQAPPVVLQKDPEGEWVCVEDHPVTELLKQPNPYYDWTLLAQGIITSLETNGNCYIEIVRRNSGEIAELWWVPHQQVTPVTEPGSPTPYMVDYFWVNDPFNGPRKVMPDELIHLKYNPDPADPRLGLSPLASAARDTNALQQGANYRPNMLRNFGVIGKFLAPKTDTVTMPSPQEVKQKLDDQSTGDMVASTIVVDFPCELTTPGVAPKDMDLGVLEDRPEANICALIGLHPQVVGLYVGRVHKTDASIKEQREAAFEEKIIPLGSMIGCQLGYVLLPQMAPVGTMSSPALRRQYMNTFKLTFDYSDIRSLQPDVDALHNRSRADWLAGLLSLADWKKTLGKDPEPGDENIFYRDRAASSGQNAVDVVPGDQQPGKPAPKKAIEAFVAPAIVTAIEENGYQYR